MSARFSSGIAVLCLLSALVIQVPAAHAQTKLLRYPDIHGDLVVFAYGGDLWLAGTGGGTATRLTAHPGQELFPHFSPDGRWVAFTGQYDGDEQVYVVPTAGGAPRQLTFYPAVGPLSHRWGYDNQVFGWSPDGESVLFRSMRYGYDLSDTRQYLVSLAGGLPEPLPMPKVGGAALSPDGSQVVYSPLVRDFRNWKRYEGGWAQELYIFDLESHDMTRVTDHPRADRDPMWIGSTIYFTSDRDGTNNLFAYDVAGGATEQLTENDVWDVRWPGDDGENRIVYESNGELVVWDIDAGTASPISITVPDDGLARRPSRISAENRIESFELSPKGERALFVARGDVFTAPIENGPTRNLTRSSGAHDKWASWSPDGRQIAYISDETGEEEIWVASQDGSEEPVQLTEGGDAMRYSPLWAPDGKRLAFSDKSGRLFILEVETKALAEIANEERGQIRDYSWSPNGGHLAFSMSDVNGFNSVYIWSVGQTEPVRVTGTFFHEFEPVWGRKGEYLFYLADRSYAPQISAIEWNFATDRETGIYALALREDVGHLFPPKSDEVEIDGKDEEETDDEDESESKAYINIEFDGLADRAVRIPVQEDNYNGLMAADGHLLYVRGAPFYYGRSADLDDALHGFSFEDREETPLADDIAGYALSADGKKVLVQHDSTYKLYDVGGSADSAKAVSTSGLLVDRVPEEEWVQIFHEVWRRFRDFFYVENMHGYDWEALREQYEPLLEHVAHRADLNYVIGEMIAELSVGHAYIQGGDWETPDRAPVALPGALLELDDEAGRYRIVRILEGQNEESRYRSPLTEVGVDVVPGDYLLAIDGEELTGEMNPYEVLRFKSDRPVTFTVGAEPTMTGTREITFDPLTSERSLRYLAWVAANRERVDEMTDGRVGYIHLPDMGGNGIREFIKWYYPQIRKEGLVVDVRGNGGGNVSQMIIERLRRGLLGIRFSRNSDTPNTYPIQTFHGHMVCLLNEDSASDGDIFPYRFRDAGLGPLIGKRSWGGVTGITGHGSLIDGGLVFVPEFGTNALDGSWIIEGYGVDPDIVVENDAKSLLEGRDPQLERGVEEVMKAIEADPKVFAPRPDPPVKTE